MSAATAPPGEYFSVPVFSPQQLLDGTTAVYLPQGLVRISDANSMQILRRLLPCAGRIVSKAELRELTGLDEDELASLTTLGFARRTPVVAKRIGSVAIVTDDIPSVRPIVAWLAESASVSAIAIEAADLGGASAAADLVMVYLNRYAKGAVREVYKHFADSAIFLTTYRLDRFLYIDSLYLPSCNTPDHYHNIETLRRKSADSFEQTGNLFNLMDRVFGDEPKLSLAIDLNQIESMRVTHLLYLHLKRALGASLATIGADEICDSFSYDLITDRLSRGRARFYGTITA